MLRCVRSSNSNISGNLLEQIDGASVYHFVLQIRSSGMRKLFLHFAVACITFSGSTHLTKIWKPRGRAAVAKQTVQLLSSATAAAESQLLDIYREYGAAQTRHDNAFFERVEAEEFKLFADGRTYSRAEDIKLMDSSSTDEVYEIDDLNVEMKGDGAVVTGRMTLTNSNGYRDSWRLIDVWIRLGHGWQILSTTQID
jgi:hypothetical protein